MPAPKHHACLITLLPHQSGLTVKRVLDQNLSQAGKWGELDNSDNLIELLFCTRAESTVTKYQRAYYRWRQWAIARRHVPLPAQPLQLCSYLQSVGSSSGSKSAVEEAVNAVSWAHTIAGLESPTRHPTVVSIMEAYRRVLAAPKNKKEPVTAEDLRKMVRMSAGPKASLADVRTIAICLISFAAFLRFDELASLRCTDVKIKEDHAEIRIRVSKTDQYRDGDSVVIARTGASTCPVQILERYICMASIDKDSENFLFRPMTNTGSMERLRQGGKLSYTRVRELVLGKLGDIGLEVSRYGLHSLRAGGATAAANGGVVDRMFKRHRRCRSENAKDGYVKDSLTARLGVSKSLGL